MVGNTGSVDMLEAGITYSRIQRTEKRDRSCEQGPSRSAQGIGNSAGNSIQQSSVATVRKGRNKYNVNRCRRRNCGVERGRIDGRTDARFKAEVAKLAK